MRLSVGIAVVHPTTAVKLEPVDMESEPGETLADSTLTTMLDYCLNSSNNEFQRSYSFDVRFLLELTIGMGFSMGMGIPR